MKKLIITLIAAFTLTAAYAANTNTPTVLEQATATAKQAVATNLNEVIVDILRGVKTAGGEVYAASKTAITKSVDFTMEQAPLVVKEFLTWQIAKAAVWTFIWIALCSIGLWISRKIRLYSASENDEEGVVVSYIIRIAALIILIAAIGVNGMTITKVAVAPRVFLIEYVVDALHGPNHNR